MSAISQPIDPSPDPTTSHIITTEYGDLGAFAFKAACKLAASRAPQTPVNVDELRALLKVGCVLARSARHELLRAGLLRDEFPRDRNGKMTGRRTVWVGPTRTAAASGPKAQRQEPATPEPTALPDAVAAPCGDAVGALSPATIPATIPAATPATAPATALVAAAPTTPAAEVLARIATHDQRLAFSPQDLAGLTPFVLAYLNSGAGVEDAVSLLTRRLPEKKRIKSGFLRWRLEHPDRVPGGPMTSSTMRHPTSSQVVPSPRVTWPPVTRPGTRQNPRTAPSTDPVSVTELLGPLIECADCRRPSREPRPTGLCPLCADKVDLPVPPHPGLPAPIRARLQAAFERAGGFIPA